MFLEIVSYVMYCPFALRNYARLYQSISCLDLSTDMACSVSMINAGIAVNLASSTNLSIPEYSSSQELQ